MRIVNVVDPCQTALPIVHLLHLRDFLIPWLRRQSFQSLSGVKSNAVFLPLQSTTIDTTMTSLSDIVTKDWSRWVTMQWVQCLCKVKLLPTMLISSSCSKLLWPVLVSLVMQRAQGLMNRLRMSWRMVTRKSQTDCPFNVLSQSRSTSQFMRREFKLWLISALCPHCIS